MTHKTGLRFGVPFLLETATVEEASELARELGLHFVELNTNFPQCLVPRLDSGTLRQIAAETGLFFTLHLDDALNFADFNTWVREASVQTVLEAISLAGEAQMPVINLHFPKGNVVTLPDGKHYIFENFTEEFTRVLLDFRRQVEEATGDADLKICIENTDGWAPYERQAIELLLESPVFGLTFDIGHNHAVDDLDLPFMETHRDRLHHMHAHDGWGQTNHQALGEGEIPLDDRLDLAKEAGATVVLETKTKAALAESVQWLKRRGYL